MGAPALQKQTQGTANLAVLARSPRSPWKEECSRVSRARDLLAAWGKGRDEFPRQRSAAGGQFMRLCFVISTLAGLELVLPNQEERVWSPLEAFCPSLRLRLNEI